MSKRGPHSAARGSFETRRGYVDKQDIAIIIGLIATVLAVVLAVAGILVTLLVAR
jgi:hypothetical protein